MQKLPSSPLASVPDYREIETVINRQTIVDQVAAFLYASGLVFDNEHVTNIQFKELFGSSDVELVPIKICLKKQQEIEVINH